MTTATPIEIKKDGLSQLQDGSWVLKVKVHPADMATWLMTAPMGTRYMAALVEIGDDEQPVTSASFKPEVPTAATESRRLSDMPRASQAGMLCGDARFRSYLRSVHKACIEEDPPEGTLLPQYAADMVIKKLFGITSKKQLDEPRNCADWDRMRADYQAWKDAPNAGAAA